MNQWNEGKRKKNVKMSHVKTAQGYFFYAGKKIEMAVSILLNMLWKISKYHIQMTKVLIQDF